MYTCNLCNIVHQFLKIKKDKSQVKKAEMKDHTLHNSIPSYEIFRTGKSIGTGGRLVIA